MKHKSIVAIVFLAACTVQLALACDCAPPRKHAAAWQHEMERATVVFIGEVSDLSPDQQSFTITIVERFKGIEINTSALQGQNSRSCSPVISTTGRWLVYGTLHNGQLEINECGLTRSMERPEANRHFTFIPPPAPAPDSTEVPPPMPEELDFMKQRAAEKAKVLMSKELEMLREYRDKRHD